MNIRNIYYLILTFTLLLGCQQQAPLPEWPTVQQENKPWTRWWWHGNAVTKAGITTNLEAIQKAGIGGVELTPIFGVIGKEEEFVTYLSPEWVALFIHTLKEAKRLGVGVDMATGTGWPFGGPWVGPEQAPKTCYHKIYKIQTGQRLEEPVSFTEEPMLRVIKNPTLQLYDQVPEEQVSKALKDPPFLKKIHTPDISEVKSPVSLNKNLQELAIDQIKFPQKLPLITLMAYSDEGTILDLTQQVDEAGQLDWVAPQGTWKLYALFQGMHGKQVERAAPGGEGNTLDHFTESAIDHYLSRFDEAFDGADISSLRAFFNDSYEVDDAHGEANWTPLLFTEFQQRRGYDLKKHLPAWLEDTDSETHRRILSDYRETVGELLLERFTKKWKQWSNTNGAMIRNQAHGSPGNLLDLYGLSDIPETEGTDLSAIRLASSAAHLTGKNLASSESATWLNEHFRSTLADIKANLDRYFLGGVNHVFYHGTTYSPADEAWPGRLFYAAIHANDRNPWWDHFRALNEYVARTQSFLQSGQPNNDLLLYLPMHDFYATPGKEPLVHFDLGKGAFATSSVRQTATWLTQKGYSFDYLSDTQLKQVQTTGNQLSTDSLNYRAILIPTSEFMPVETLEKITQLAEKGATVISLGDLPSSPPGFFKLEERKQKFQESIQKLTQQASFYQKTTSSEDLGTEVLRETMADLGIQFIRRKIGDGFAYFLLNNGDRAINQYVPLAKEATSISVYNPMTGNYGIGQMKEDNGVAVFLQLAPGESLIVVTSKHLLSGPKYPYYQRNGDPVQLSGAWKLNFIKGGPELPESLTIDALGSWTQLAGEQTAAFSGTASYTYELERPDHETNQWLLHLGDVKETANVLLNGKEIGTLTGPPYQILLDAKDMSEHNTLEIQVSNLMANRIADLDKKGAFWKKFYNVNFPARLAENRVAGLFDASLWQPLPSGLIGPVRLVPMKRMEFERME